MGQAFRRASGRIRATRIDNPPPPPPPPSSSRPPKSKTVIDHRQSTTPTMGPIDRVTRTGQSTGPASAEESPRVNADNILEERDPKYDAMLSQMVGRIRTKPGGKPEMGEAFVVQKSNRPMPKLRNTTTDSGNYEARPAPPGTLNVAQLRHIMLLHQGKADDHDGAMDKHQIAEKYRIDVELVQHILQFLSLPPEDTPKQKNSQ